MSERAREARLPWRAVLAALALGSLIALVLLHEVASPLRVEGASMSPTLEDGTVCLVLWTASARRDVDTGSIVVARLPSHAGGARIVKRVAEVRGAPPLRRLVLAGDNGGTSRDSRDYGEIREARVEGVLVARIYPHPAYWGVAGPSLPAMGSRDALSPAGR